MHEEKLLKSHIFLSMCASKINLIRETLIDDLIRIGEIDADDELGTHVHYISLLALYDSFDELIAICDVAKRHIYHTPGFIKYYDQAFSGVISNEENGVKEALLPALCQEFIRRSKRIHESPAAKRKNHD